MPQENRIFAAKLDELKRQALLKKIDILTK